MNIIKTVTTLSAIFSVFVLLPANSATSPRLVAHRTSLGKWKANFEPSTGKGGNCQHLTAMGFVNSTLNIDISNENSQDAAFNTAGQHDVSYHTGVYNTADIDPAAQCIYLDGAVTSDFTVAELQNLTLSTWSYLLLSQNSDGSYAVDGNLSTSYQSASQSDANWFDSATTTTDPKTLTTWSGNFAPFIHLPLTTTNGNSVACTVVTSGSVDLTSLPLPSGSSSSSSSAR